MSHSCSAHLIFSHTEDRLYPYGDIQSLAVFMCEVCGKLFTEESEEVRYATNPENKR